MGVGVWGGGWGRGGVLWDRCVCGVVWFCRGFLVLLCWVFVYGKCGESRGGGAQGLRVCFVFCFNTWGQTGRAQITVGSRKTQREGGRRGPVLEKKLLDWSSVGRLGGGGEEGGEGKKAVEQTTVYAEISNWSAGKKTNKNWGGRQRGGP